MVLSRSVLQLEQLWERELSVFNLGTALQYSLQKLELELIQLIHFCCGRSSLLAVLVGDLQLQTDST